MTTGWSSPGGGSGWSTPGGAPGGQPGGQPGGGPAGQPGEGGPGATTPAAWDAAAVPAGWGGGQPLPQAPRPGVVPLRPLGLGELLDGAVGLVRGYPGAVLGASALVALVSTLVQVVLVLAVLAPVLQVDEAALEAGDTDALVGLLAGATAGVSVAGLLAVVTGALLTGALSAVAGKAVLGQPFTFSDLRTALRGKVLRLVGAAFVVQIAVFAPLLLALALTVGLAAVTGGVGGLVGLVLVPGALVLAVLLYVRLSLAASAVVLEGAGVGTALRRSSELVRGSFWRVLGILLLALVVAQFAGQVLQLPFLLLGSGSPLEQLTGSGGLGTADLLASTLGAGVAAFLVEPFAAGVRALLYVDRRMRAEGLDVALRAAASSR